MVVASLLLDWLNCFVLCPDLPVLDFCRYVTLMWPSDNLVVSYWAEQAVKANVTLSVGLVRDDRSLDGVVDRRDSE